MPLRIIVVDDEDDDRGWIVNALEGQGYEVFAPRDITELIQLIDTSGPHCVLCDQYLDDKYWGYSGSQLAEELGGTVPWVLMTKRPIDFQDVTQAWLPGKGRSSKLQHFYNKVDPIATLLEIMQDVVSTHIPLNFSLTMAPRDIGRIMSLVAPELLGAADGAQIEQLRESLKDLLRMLFRSYRELTIKRELSTGGGLCLLHVVARYEHGPGDHLLLLCGLRQPVCRILTAYKAHSRGGALSRIDSRTRLDTAGAVFAFNGDLDYVLPLSEIWLNRPAGQHGELLDRVVRQSLSTWPLHGEGQVAGPEALARTAERLRLLGNPRDPEVAEQRLRAICRAAAPSLHLTYTAERCFELVERDGARVTLPPPLDALAHLERLGAGWSAPYGPVYGADHPEQILVDEQRGQPIFWNFGLVTEGALRLLYFALIEAHLRSEALQRGSTLDHYEIERAVLAADDDRPIPALSTSAQAQVATLAAFRRSVRRHAGLDDMRPYYATMLLCALEALRLDDISGRVDEGDIRALLGALVLTELLLGPAEADGAQEGLFIDPQTKEVYVDGIRIEQERGQITPQDRQFLLYLYQRHDQLCSYQDIVRDVYGSATQEELQRMSSLEWGKLLEREQPRIYATLNRLRMIIEPEGDGPNGTRRRRYKYLITRTGVGVMLRPKPGDEYL
jgi:DNA-binding response OmpR family regulator